MSAAAGAIWVLLATGVAMLPMRLQFAPGLTLLLCAPLLIFWLGYDYGWLAAGFGTFALLSMFRRPLVYYWRKAFGMDREEAE